MQPGQVCPVRSAGAPERTKVDAFRVRSGEDAGARWDLFVGDNTKLRELVTNLNDKWVVARGRLRVLTAKRHPNRTLPSRFPLLIVMLDNISEDPDGGKSHRGDVSVEVKGKLGGSYKILWHWDACLQYENTGIEIIAPGNKDYASAEELLWQDTGLKWHLFLGDLDEHKALYESVRKLRHKLVIVRGPLKVVGQPTRMFWGPTSGRWTPWIAVLPRSIEAQ